jgi:hypothetical protein
VALDDRDRSMYVRWINRERCTWCRMSKRGVCSYRRSREVFVALDERDERMWCRMSKGDVCSYERVERGVCGSR